MIPTLIQFDINGDTRGSLIALEEHKNIPFSIKRVYYIFGTKPNITRGLHAHIRLKQVLICLSGQCTVLLDDGTKRVNVLLNSPDKGLLIEHLIWREMSQFSPDCILMVLADQVYAEEDYIRSYTQFIDLKKVEIATSTLNL